MLFRKIFILLNIICLSSIVLAQEKVLDLKSAFKLALELNSELEVIDKQLRVVDYKTKALNKAYNINFINTSSFSYDQSAADRLIQLDSSKQYAVTSEVNKLFSTGSLFKLKATFLHEEFDIYTGTS